MSSWQGKLYLEELRKRTRDIRATHPGTWQGAGHWTETLYIFPFSDYDIDIKK
jgi:hypothetical protein